MWIYFNQKGQLIKSLEHGAPARAGSTDFKIFAVFSPEIDILAEYSYATLKLTRPDREQTSYISLPMFLATKKFNYFGLENAQSVYPFADNVYYNGFIFDFGDFKFGDEVISLLDTPGLWKATITLSNTKRNSFIQGQITFNVEPGISDENTSEITLDEVLRQVYLSIGTKLDKKSDRYLKIIDDSLTAIEFDSEEFTIGDIIFNKDRKAFYVLKNYGNIIYGDTLVETGLNIDEAVINKLVNQEIIGNVGEFEELYLNGSPVINFLNGAVVINDITAISTAPYPIGQVFIERGETLTFYIKKADSSIQRLDTFNTVTIEGEQNINGAKIFAGGAYKNTKTSENEYTTEGELRKVENASVRVIEIDSYTNPDLTIGEAFIVFDPDKFIYKIKYKNSENQEKHYNIRLEGSLSSLTTYSESKDWKSPFSRRCSSDMTVNEFMERELYLEWNGSSGIEDIKGGSIDLEFYNKIQELYYGRDPSRDNHKQSLNWFAYYAEGTEFRSPNTGLSPYGECYCYYDSELDKIIIININGIFTFDGSELKELINAERIPCYDSGLGADNVQDALDALLFQKADISYVNQIVSTVWRPKGSVQNYSDLPSDPRVGDVYNIVNADPEHGIQAGENVVWDGEQWDELGGVFDTSEIDAEITQLKKDVTYLATAGIIDAVYNNDTGVMTFTLSDGTNASYDDDTGYITVVYE